VNSGGSIGVYGVEISGSGGVCGVDSGRSKVLTVADIEKSSHLKGIIEVYFGGFN
jgi:hypothetical protein